MRLVESELARWGRRIGAEVRAPVVIGLSGRLGAGKSVLARAIGAGAGVSDPMPSPSYNLLFRYSTPNGYDVVHLDLYRMESPDELWELGWGQPSEADEIVLVEWPERAGPFLPEDRWEIRLLVPEDDPLTREVDVRRCGRPADLPPFPMSVSG